MENEIKPGSFADGVRKINTRGALVLPARLTKKRGRLLLEFIDQFKHNWYCDHDEKDPGYKEDENDMQMAMRWILNEVNKRWSQNELYTDK
jgi:hypothetical protein